MQLSVRQWALSGQVRDGVEWQRVGVLVGEGGEVRLVVLLLLLCL